MPLEAVLIALMLGACSGDELRATFNPDNPLTATRAWDNAVSLQPAASDASETVAIVIRGGRAPGASDTEPEAPAHLLLAGVTRLRATLIYNPEVVDYSRFDAGNFFEQAAPGARVSYSITAEEDNGQRTGRLFVDVSVPASASAVRKGDFVKLHFAAVARGVTAIEFEGGFGTIERNGLIVTGVGFYGGDVFVVSSST
jgi:hypothetical protein